MTSSPRFAREKKAPDFSRNLSEQLKDTFSESVLIILNTTKTNINLLQFTVKNVLFHSIIVILDQVSSKILQEMCFNIVSSQMLCFATQRDECWVLHEGSAESVLPEKQGKAERRDDFAWKRQVLSVSHQPMFCKRFNSLLLIGPSFVSNFYHGVCRIFNFHWTRTTSCHDGLQRILWLNPFCTIGMFLPSRLPSYSIFCIEEYWHNIARIMDVNKWIASVVQPSLVGYKCCCLFFFQKQKKFVKVCA